MALFLVFCVVFCGSCPFVLCLLGIVLSVLLQYMGSDYFFYIYIISSYLIIILYLHITLLCVKQMQMQKKKYFSGVCVTQSEIFYVVFCRSLFVIFLPINSLFFFDVRFLIIPLTSSNFS